MSLDLLFSQNSDKPSTKTLILESLVYSPRLSNVEIQHTIRKKFNRKISFQAIRQALIELFDQGVLIKEGKEYSISIDWLNRIHHFVELAQDSQNRSSKILSIEKDVTLLEVQSLAELGWFVLHALEYKYFDFEKNNEFFVSLDHLWIPFNSYVERNKLKKIFKENNTHVIIKNNSLGDRILAQWYKQLGKLKLNVATYQMCQYLVSGDCVIEIYMDESLKKKMDEAYKFKNLLSSDIIKKFDSMTFDKHTIQLRITKNKNIADSIKSLILSHF